MATHTIHINRAPVLTLWAAVAAERLGYDHEAALTLGKAVPGLMPNRKGGDWGCSRNQKARQRTGNREHAIRENSSW